ncbi:Mediator of RNA polymerase II transcription subunit 14 [Rhodotorula toruloides ATCC 204091]|uniref:Mediator of RNA polymerase II transcription subunit 14 n=1 Tax=Rhodotorula toruloides TaxID=5286 RepID=A0A0K3CG79_RHOTO|nr:Mediator of RNA polymerase II transcription subunit 14 [Rhodotorula toruloides ATCC 204091]KAK4334908.1 Mediator of RNA polymerase II transcription subunit 14 [Rhodotorula toruloides]PRQ76311.1 Mediator complex subunit MED14-domain containing protein [Rhodotorula toruloides]
MDTLTAPPPLPPPTIPNGTSSHSQPSTSTHAHSSKDPQPEPALERELPVILQDLVPLSYIIDRVVAQAYSDLANLVETLPSQNDQARKRAIVDYVLQTRRQVVKLLVLARWSTEAERIQRAMNIVGFLSMQNHTLESTITSLTETRTMLSGARVRNYDLSTALAVLSTGTYTGLPASMREGFEEGAEKMGDEEVIDTLREVDEVIRWRLVMGKEYVPKEMRRRIWRVGDGRVVFGVEGLWEASFTYGGGKEDPDEDEDDERAEEGAEWFLLGVKFLFRVKDARGVWSSTPLGPLKDHLIDLCNRQLLRRPYLPPSPEPPQPPQPHIDAPPPTEADANREEKEKKWNEERREVIKKRRRDRPLNRAYTFLQRLALSYQLEAVHSSAARLAQTSWKGSLRVERAGQEREEVRVEYWSYRPDGSTTARQPSSTASRPGPGGTIIFSLRTPSPSSSSADAPAAPPPSSTSRQSVRERALRAALAKASSSTLPTPTASDTSPATEADDRPSDPDVPSRLSVTWLPPSSYAPSSASLDLSALLGSDLDVEAVIRQVTARHARETVQRLAEVVVGQGGEGAKGATVIYPKKRNDGDGAGTGDEAGEEVPYLHFPLVGPHAVSAHIVPTTGRFEFRLASASAASTGGEDGGIEEGEGSAAREQRLRLATERIEKERYGIAQPGQQANATGEDGWMRAVVDVVARIRASTILDDLETLVSLLSLPLASPPTRRLPLAPREYSKLGPNPAALTGRAAHLFIPLLRSTSGSMKDWFVVLVLFEEGVRAALVRTEERSDGMGSWLEIGEVGWIGGASAKAKGKERAGEGGVETGVAGTNLGYEIKAETLRSLWWHCVHRVALFKVEQQVHSRRIPYRLVDPSSANSNTAPSPLFAKPPKAAHLAVQPAGLLALSDAAKIADGEGAVLCVVGDGGLLRTTLHVRLRPTIASSLFSPSTKLPPNVLFNPSSGVLILATEDDLDGAFERLLRAYAILARALFDAYRARGRTDKRPSATAASPKKTAFAQQINGLKPGG